MISSRHESPPRRRPHIRIHVTTHRTSNILDVWEIDSRELKRTLHTCVFKIYWRINQRKGLHTIKENCWAIHHHYFIERTIHDCMTRAIYEAVSSFVKAKSSVGKWKKNLTVRTHIVTHGYAIIALLLFTTYLYNRCAMIYGKWRRLRWRHRNSSSAVFTWRYKFDRFSHINQWLGICAFAFACHLKKNLPRCVLKTWLPWC